MADNKVNSGLLEFSEDQKVFVALDAETSEVKKAVTIDGDGVETDIAGGGGGDVTVEALSVTENGTYSEEGKAYSPVTVNVEGADVPTARLTLSMSQEIIEEEPVIAIPNIANGVLLGYVPNYGTTTNVDIPLIGESCVFKLIGVELKSITGNMVYDSEHRSYTITGDATAVVNLPL